MIVNMVINERWWIYKKCRNCVCFCVWSLCLDYNTMTMESKRAMFCLSVYCSSSTVYASVHWLSYSSLNISANFVGLCWSLKSAMLGLLSVNFALKAALNLKGFCKINFYGQNTSFVLLGMLTYAIWSCFTSTNDCHICLEMNY